MSRFLNRLYRAALLDVDLFREVVADTQALRQAMIAAFLYSAAAAYGSFGRVGVVGINIAMVSTLISWYIWVFMTYFAGARLFPEAQTTPDRKAVVRAMGFASSPGLIRLLGLMPGMSSIALLVATLWMIVTSTAAVKQALNYTSIYRAAGVCLIGWILSVFVQLLLLVSLFSVFGVPSNPY
jgi:hypothetical protein